MSLTNIAFVVDVFALVLAVILVVYLGSYIVVWRQQRKLGLERRRYDFRMYSYVAALFFAITLFLRLFASNDIAFLIYSVLNVAILGVFIIAFQMKFQEAVTLVSSASSAKKEQAKTNVKTNKRR